MAIIPAYGNGEKIYEGKVLTWWEHNGAWDSDWYAEVWDDETESVKVIEIGTTRFGGGTGFTVEIDATDDVLLKMYRKKKKAAREDFALWNEAQAKQIRKGDDVLIVKGRKVKKGSVVKCFWAGRTYNRYSRRYEDRIGVECDGQKVFIAAENGEVVGWEKRLLHGKERKEKIRDMAISYMPCGFRNRFSSDWYFKKKNSEQAMGA